MSESTKPAVGPPLAPAAEDQGDAVAAFARAFARWAGAGHAFAFWKGRVALYAILRAMGVGQGDQVILPGYTCVMNVNPVKYLGAEALYADIDPVTFNVRPELIERKITPRTKAVIAQHTYGYPCEMDAISDLTGRHGIPVIEDCCLAPGSRYKGRLCGSFGLAAYWSFQWNKTFTTGIGGMATTRDASLAWRIEELTRRHLGRPGAWAQGMLALQRLIHGLVVYPATAGTFTALFRWLTKRGLVVGSSSAGEFTPAMAADFFTGMGAAQARAGLEQTARIEQNLAHRRRLAQAYDELLAEAGWQVHPLPAYMDPVLVRYPLRVADKKQALAGAAQKGLELGSWFECPLHPAGTPMHLYAYQDGCCPVAEKACRETVNLPTHLRTTPATARRTVDFIRRIGPPA